MGKFDVNIFMFGASKDGGIMGIFGSCQEKATTNARNIEKLGKFAIALEHNLEQLSNSTNQHFFVSSQRPCNTPRSPKPNN